jgi:hypothetical protein
MKLLKSVVCVALLVSFISVGLSAAALAQGVLTEDEKEGLLQMREEEKLARDVYINMYALYGKTIFSNIIESEQRHMDAVKGLLDRYHLDDPAAGNGVGVFTDSHIQDLYYELCAKGALSLIHALEVGVIIEELDISDLDKLLTTASKRDIIRVYENLREGSYNHLAAFEGQLD